MSIKSASHSTVAAARAYPAPAHTHSAPAPGVVQRVIQTRNAEDPALRTWIVLARAYHTIVRAVSRDVSRHRLTLGQFAVMEALYHKGALPLGKVSSLLLVTAGNITYVVDQLERRGLVRRERRHGDRRVVYAALTAKGRALIDDIFPSHARYIAELFDTLPPDEQGQLRKLLKKLGFAVAALEDHGADA